MCGALKFPVSWMNCGHWFLKQRRWPMGCRRLVGRRWTSASIHRSGLTLLTTTYMYGGAVLLWMLSSGVIFSLQFFSRFLFLSKRTASKFMLWCRSRTSGFTTLVLVLSHTSQTASSSRSHGHVFLRIYSVSILAPYLLVFSVTSKPTASFRLAFSVTSKPTASFRFTEQRDIWYWEDRMSHVLVASLNLTMGSRLSGVMISDAVCSYVLHTPVVLQQILLKQWCIQSWIRDNPKFHMMSRTVF